MRSLPATASILLVSLAMISPSHAQPADRPADRAIRVYGLEVETRFDRERLLIFGDEPIEFSIETLSEDTVVLKAVGALLAASAPRKINTQGAHTIRSVTTRERLRGVRPELQIQIRHEPGPSPRLTREGAIVAVEFEVPVESTARAEIPLRFEDAEIADVVRYVGDETGERYVFDETLRGRITIATTEPVTSEAAVAILDAALLLKGFAASPGPGGFRKILQIKASPGRAPWILREPESNEDAPVATLLRLRSASAREVLATLRPLIGASTIANTHDLSNSIIIAGAESSVSRLLSLAITLDEARSELVVVRRVLHRSAEELAPLVAASMRASDGAGSEPEVWAWPHGNSLVLRATPGDMDRLRATVARLDQPVVGGGDIRVIRILNQEPERIAEILRTLSQARRNGDAANPPTGLEGLEIGLAVDEPTHSLIVRADTESHARIAAIVAELDRQSPRVSVELFIFEVNTASQLSLSFDAFTKLTNPKSPEDIVATVLAAPGAGRATPPVARFTQPPLVIPIVDANGNPVTLTIPGDDFILAANQQEVRTRVIARPHIVGTSGEEHEFFAGDNVPIPVARADQPVGSLTTSLNIERQDVGVRMRVEPTLGEAGGVRIKLDLETTAVTSSVAGDVEDVGPTLAQRRVQATMMLRDQEIAIVGLVPQSAYERVESGTPFLKDIPILGNFFKASRRSERTNHFVVAIQATVLRSREEDLANTIRRRMAFQRSVARRGQLDADTPYAILVTTRTHKGDADAIAAAFRSDGLPSTVSRWKAERDTGISFYDVYLTDFESLVDASRAADGARASGWDPELVVLPSAPL